MLLNDFLTIDDIAQILRVTRQTVSKLIKAKDIVAYKVNKSYRVSKHDLVTFLQTKALVKDNQHISTPKAAALSLPGNYKNGTSAINEPKQGAIAVLQKEHSGQYNQFIFGDNLDVLNALLPQLKNKVDLIYIDPPFGTGKVFNTIDHTSAYSDKLPHFDFLDFLRARLLVLKQLLSAKGSIYVHIDKKTGHYVKVMMDEVFGFDNFINDITRIKCNPKNFSRNAYGNYSDMILFYAKERDKNIWNNIKDDLSDEKQDQLFKQAHPIHGKYTTHPLHAPGITMGGDTGKEWNGLMPPPGRHWRYSRAELSRMNDEGLIEWSDKGIPRKIVFAKDHKGIKIQDVWEFKDKGLSYADYPTQKNTELLKRIILNSSNPNSIVLDCFAGSGSTLYTANSLGRKWIGIDNSAEAFNVIKTNFINMGIKCNYHQYQPIT
jgi:adenine-specific DNA-methyltransferase